MDRSDVKTAERWWQSMMLPPEQLQRFGIRVAPTVFKARLRRCESVEAAMMTEGFRDLWLNLPDEVTAKARPTDIERWALTAAALVHVQPGLEGRPDYEANLGLIAGRHTDSGKSAVSELRFAQLQAAQTPDEFLRRLRRVLKQVKGQVSPGSLVKDINRWFSERYNLFPRKADDRLAVRWAMDYYKSAASAKNN